MRHYLPSAAHNIIVNPNTCAKVNVKLYVEQQRNRIQPSSDNLDEGFSVGANSLAAIDSQHIITLDLKFVIHDQVYIYSPDLRHNYSCSTNINWILTD